jgi:hypothetical protein
MGVVDLFALPFYLIIKLLRRGIIREMNEMWHIPLSMPSSLSHPYKPSAIQVLRVFLVSLSEFPCVKRLKFACTNASVSLYLH